MGYLRQLGFAGLDVDRRADQNETAHLAWIARSIGERQPAPLAQPEQIGAAAELVHRHIEIGKVAVD